MNLGLLVRHFVPASTASRKAMLITPFQMRKRAP